MGLPALTDSGKCFAPGATLRTACGFTIIEMMITILIMSILLIVAGPSLSDLVRDQRIKTATFDVFASLTFARSEAIKRNANVDIVPVASDDWAGGWSVKSGITTLRSQAAISNIIISGPSGTVTYQNSGRLSGTTAPNFVLKSSQSSAITARCVRVDLSGRPNVKADTDRNPANGCQ